MIDMTLTTEQRKALDHFFNRPQEYEDNIVWDRFVKRVGLPDLIERETFIEIVRMEDEPWSASERLWHHG